jgi:hypothetical protein
MSAPAQPDSSAVPRYPRPELGVAAAYGALIYFMLPPEVFVVNDDFGYLRSVLATLQHGRPWTGEWLEPWAASLAVLSAAVFKVTGSMHAATSALQAVFAAAAVGGANRLLRDRGLSSAASLVVAVLLVSVPTLFWKSLEYTAGALYLPCLLWALWAAERRRWGWFFGLWLIAFASRQSAIAWLIVPAVAGLREFCSTAPGATLRRWRQPALVLVGGAGALALLSLGMNKTQSQAMVTDQLWPHAQWDKAWPSLVFGAGVFLAAAGLGAFALNGRVGGRAAGRLRPWESFGVLATGALLWTLWGLDPLVPYFEHGSFSGPVGFAYLKLLGATALAGWMISRFAVRWEMAAAALGSLALVGLRHEVWDYYFLDAALFGFFAPVVRPAAGAGEETPRWPKFAVISTVVVFGAFHVYFTVHFKLSIDRQQAVCTLAEKTLRAGRIEVTELSFAPYGFIGWHLHPHFVAHEGRADPDVGGFMGYLRKDAVGVRFSPVRFWRDSRSLRPDWEDDGRTVIASEIFPVCWLWAERVSLLRNPPPLVQAPKLRLDASSYRPVPFPLNRAEWQREARAPQP